MTWPDLLYRIFHWMHENPGPTLLLWVVLFGQACTLLAIWKGRKLE